MLCSLLLALAAWASAAPPEARLELSTTTAQLGTPVSAHAQAAPGLMPDLERSTTDTFSISVVKQEDQAGSVLWTFSILPLAVGKIPVTLYWKGAGSQIHSSVELMVHEPAIPADAEIADIKRPARARPAIWPWLLALAAGAAAWLAWKRRRLKQGDDDSGNRAAEPPQAPHAMALAQLDALASTGLWAEQRYKEFYAALTEILRLYLERAFGLPALKLTTAELAKQLRRAEVDRKAVGLFRELFDRADLVKFAKTVPEQRQGSLDLDAARQFVRLTAPTDLAAGGHA